MDLPIPPTPIHPESIARADPSASTVRRNPPRRARGQPPAAAPSTSPPSLPAPVPFSVRDPSDTKQSGAPENLRVFLRIRPPESPPRPGRRDAGGDRAPRGRGVRDGKPKQAAKKKNDTCLTVNGPSSVTLTAPPSVLDPKRAKSEVYDGFSHVFPPDSSQVDVYEKVMSPLVRDFMGGKSGLLAAMGPTGSGKTYTVFGTPRSPGLLTLLLHDIFGSESEEVSSNQRRSFYISMFEISCEWGKGERIIDLSPSGSEVFLQQSLMKGLQEVMVTSVVDAECLIARGMLKRATSITNANNKSSRSQCIINIRHSLTTSNAEYDASNVVLTIVDLAGAERERKTGNQGARLVESGFINNTSMVFGLCLRSLLENQKNPKKQLQKHFQNSLLTRYLRDYLEGKKRFTLILTARNGELDYPEISCLLRQASPYMHIKFHCVEESNPPCRKRLGFFSGTQSTKRRNCDSTNDISENAGKQKGDAIPQLDQEEVVGSSKKIESKQNFSNSQSLGTLKVALPDGCYAELQKLKRSEHILLGFSKALWSVLKQYKQKLEVSEREVRELKENLIKESSQVVLLEKKLQNLQLHCARSEHSSHEASSLNDEGESKYFSAIQLDFSGRELSMTVEADIKDGMLLEESNATKSSQDEIENGDHGVVGSDVKVNHVVHNRYSPDAGLVNYNSKQSSMISEDARCRTPSNVLQTSTPDEDKLELCHSSIANGGNVGEYVGNKSPPKVTDVQTLKPPKPRRQLMPASAMLLKEFRGVDVEVENSKVRGAEKDIMRGGQRSRGSMTLLRLLRSAAG